MPKKAPKKGSKRLEEETELHFVVEVLLENKGKNMRKPWREHEEAPDSALEEPTKLEQLLWRLQLIALSDLLRLLFRLGFDDLFHGLASMNRGRLVLEAIEARAALASEMLANRVESIALLRV